MPDGSMRVVVVQSAAQVRHYAGSERRAGDLVVPIGPEAMYFSLQQRWQTCALGELWSQPEYERGRHESQEKIDHLIAALDEYGRRWKPELGLEIGRYYGFQLYGFVGHLHYNYFVAQSIARRLRPDAVLIYSKAGSSKTSDPHPDADRVFADVASRSGCLDHCNLEIRRIAETREIVTLKTAVRNALPEALVETVRNVRTRWKLRNFRQSKYRLLLTGGAYDWMNICAHPAFREVFSLHAMPRLISRCELSPPSDLVEILNASVNSARGPIYGMDRYAGAIYADMRLYAAKDKKVRKKLTRYDALVTGVLCYPFEVYLAHIATKLNKPVVVWQHGEKGQSREGDIALYTELFYATDYFAYGAAVSELYKTWIPKSRLANVEVVGSLGKKVEWAGGETIVYATGKWLKTAVSFTELPDPDSRLSRAQQVILDYLDTIGGEWPVVLKANNTAEANAIPYDYKHICVDYITPFTELLKTAKIVILDTPATTLVEACSTKVPIFAVSGRTAYLEDFVDKVKRRVVWCETPEELVTKLDEYARTGKYDADVNDTSYLNHYSAHVEPDQVVQKVKNGLRMAIERSRGAHAHGRVSALI